MRLGWLPAPALLLAACLPRATADPTPTPGVPAGPVREGAAVAYDSARSRLVLFGGDDRVAQYDETWTWEGGLWAKLQPSRHPSSRTGAAMVYDPRRRVVVLFGGFAGAKTWLDDTWTWDGSAWTQQHPALVPPARSQPALAFDPARGSVVMAGGFSSATGALTDAWSWDGKQWKALPAPPSLNLPQLVPDGQRLLLLTVAPEAGRVRGQVWTLAGTGWTRIRPVLSLPDGPPVAAFDGQRKAVVALVDDDTWTWEGATWKRLHATGQVPFLPRSAVYADRPGLLLVRGLLGGLWAWDGQAWSQLEPPPTDPKVDPTARSLRVTPAEAERRIRAGAQLQPILLPSTLPAGADAKIMLAADRFAVTYRSDDRDREVRVSANVGENPPPPTSNGTQAVVGFRGGRSTYQVDDATGPRSRRWIEWFEPPCPQPKCPGVSYFLSADGLTDVEFWQTADSLR